VRADTICLHGDQDGALMFAQALRAALVRQSIVPRAFP
ncbi:MAG: LamB/YcsF family, partial [Pseudomonadota bacterium]